MNNASANETRRLDALRAYEILDTPPEQSFDDLARLAAAVCETPIALVSFIDDRRQWFKARTGFDAAEPPREVSFCAQAISGRDIFLVPNTLTDDRFSTNPYVSGPPHIRFYAGMPLLTSSGEALGTISVMDRSPRALTPAQQDGLRALGRQVMTALELRRARAGASEEDRKRAEELLHAITEGTHSGWAMRPRRISSTT
jgi:GAF domain-containing protein